MRIFEIEKLYEINGLNEYKLRSTEDLLKCHGIDLKTVDGYNRLDDLSRIIYEKFILNFFNAFGLESRSTLIPKGIYYVEETNYLVKENPEDDYYIVAGGVIMAVDRSGLKSVLHKWENEEYRYFEMNNGEVKQYLKFEYEHQGHMEWLHVIGDGKEWY